MRTLLPLGILPDWSLQAWTRSLRIVDLQTGTNMSRHACQWVDAMQPLCSCTRWRVPALKAATPLARVPLQSTPDAALHRDAPIKKAASATRLRNPLDGLQNPRWRRRSSWYGLYKALPTLMVSKKSEEGEESHGAAGHTCM